MAVGTEVRNFAIGVAILAVLAGVVFVIRKRGDIVAAVNPLDERNVINRAVSGAVQAITGDKDATLGTFFQEIGERTRRRLGVSARVPEGAPLPSGARCFVPPCPPGTYLLIRTNSATGAREGYNVSTGKWERIMTRQTTFGVPAKPIDELAITQGETFDFTGA